MKVRDGAGPSLLIGALSSSTGVNIETIRYYERIGLLPPPQRTRGRHRLYTNQHLKVLNLVRRARDLGFSLNDVRALLAVSNTSSPCRTAKAISDQHLANIRARLASLTKLEQALKTMTNKCRPDAQLPCPIIEALAGQQTGGK